MTLRDIVRHIPKEPLIGLPGVRRLWRRFPVGSVHVRTRFDIWERPAYAYGVYSSAKLAKELGISPLSAIEFGAARGTGLVALENVCAEVSAALNMAITVYGPYSRHGNPKPVDYRDIPY